MLGSRAAKAEEGRYLSQEFYEKAISNFNAYEPELWVPTLSITMTTFMMMPWLLITLFCFALTWFVETFASPEVRSFFSIPTDAHIVLGSALSFLIVFRTNTSYDRWWAARNSWDEIGSHCQSLAVLTAPCLDAEERRLELINQLMCFVIVCKNSLRDEPTDPSELGPLLDWQHIRAFEATPCPPLAAVDAMACTVRQSVRESALGSAKAHSGILRSEALFDKLCDAIGTCDRIKSTPMVFGYVATLRTFLIMWLSTLPMALIGEYGWLATPVVSLLAFLFLNIEQMAIEIEQPFGHDANDLPIEGYILELEKWMLHMRPSLIDGGKAHHRRLPSSPMLRAPPAPPEAWPLQMPPHELSYGEWSTAGPGAHSAELVGRPPLYGAIYDAGAAGRARPEPARPTPYYRYRLASLSRQTHAHSTDSSFAVPSSAAHKRYCDSRRWRPAYVSLAQLARDSS